jgi:tRNA(Ile)-lysidine synthase
MLNAFLTYINDEKLFSDADKLLIAVSGGKDSMVLLNLLQRGKFNIGVAHVNFKLRGNDSNKDESFVKAYCEQRNIPFFTTTFNTKKYAKENGISTQMAARDLRYDWFEEVLSENNFDYLLTAHHASDNVETALLNLTRGTGIAGFTGISAKKDLLIRPLLFTTRSEIDTYATERNIQWREDSSNASTDYARNMIRHEVIPKLKTLNPNLEHTFQRTTLRLKATEFAWNTLVESVKKEVWVEEKNAVKINAEVLKSHPHNLAVTEALLKAYGFTWQQTEDALSAVSSASFIAESHTLFVDRKDWFLATNESLKSVNVIVNDILEEIFVKGMKFNFEIVESFPEKEELQNPDFAFLDYEKLPFPLTIRTWQQGDKFQPFGMQGSKLLSDYFIDLKLPLHEKKRQLILTDNRNIAWVIGKRTSQRFAVNSKMEKVLKISVSEV